MKKISIALLALATAGLAASCQKEETVEQGFTPMTINAVSEGIGTATKVEMAYKYDLLWQADDKIYVTDGTSSDTFTLSEGAGTTKGTFAQDGCTTFAGEVQAYYPQSLINGNDLVWPAVQTNSQTVPMYSSKTVSSSVEYFNFSSLGCVLQIAFNSMQEGVTLRSIEIKDGTATLSGTFTVDPEGKANITSIDKAGITLDLGEAGVALGNAAKYFNIAVPAGDYQDLTLVFTATDGAKCTMTGGKVSLAHNTVGRVTLAGSSFKKNRPAGALEGEFSVSASKKVYFSRGNLYWDGDSFEFETNQYDSQSSWNPSHVSHFFWSKEAALAYAESYDKSKAAEGDVFFTNSTEETPKADFIVNDVAGQFRALSADEWDYLLNQRANASNLNKPHVNIIGKGDCLVLAPDNWDTDISPIQASYSEDAWGFVESKGFVCLPATGNRLDTSISGNTDTYWSSSSISSIDAYRVLVNEGGVFSKRQGSRSFGFSVRLVTDVK